MFQVKRIRGKLPTSLTRAFKTYEAARSAVRKFLRTKPEKRVIYDRGWRAYSNPSINDYGFTITKAR